jgi:hypothetical protein
MAETEIVDFNVRLNELDLAQQLARVREQIELTMGAAASAATPHGGISNIVSPYVYTPPPPIPMEGVYSAPSQMQGLGDMLDSAARYTSLGFSKFNEDVRRVGLRANVFGDPTQLNAPPYGNAVIPQGTMGSFLGTVYPTFGGFDRNTARMTSTEFRQKSADVFNDNVTEMVVNNGFGMTGALGGLAVAG